jgi:hypothetical protein
MAYLFVLVVAAAVGAAAFRATLRQGAAPTAAGSSEPAGVPVPAPGAGQTFLPLTDYRNSWESRLTGALGLVIAVVVGALALALGTYLSFAFVVKLVHRSVG